MGDIKKLNKFEEDVKKLNEYEENEKLKSAKVVEKISGKNQQKEKRVRVSAYLKPEVYEAFTELNEKEGISSSTVINVLIKQYLNSKNIVL